MAKFQILALADDMTGALEAGAKFSAAGIHTIVSAKPVSAGLASVVVFDTETRHLAPEDAASEVTRFVGANRPQLIYKKTDSTLRGNISAELDALARLFPDWRIGYAPAYPALNRTVRSGILHVDGIAVSETEFGSDALNPVLTSSVSAILNPDLACTIFDGENDADLMEAARAILSDPTMRIAAGPASLAEMIAREIGLSRSAPPRLPFVRNCIILNGSRHPCAAIQMREAEAGRLAGTRAASTAGSPGWHVVRRDHEPGADAVAVAAGNAKYMAERIAMEKPDAVFVVGGDTAFALLRELGISALTPVAEAVPGVPISLTGRGFYLITKAGGFGAPDLIARVHARLNHA